jgi:ketosteroid isomerase-like protein
MSEIDVNKALVRRYFEEFFNGRDVRGAGEVCATDYLEHAVAPFAESEPGPVDGPEHLKQTVRWLTEQYPDLRMDVEALVAERDLVVARVLSYGTNHGRLNGVLKPTGKCFSARQTHWFRVADGKLAEHWATREDLTAMLQLGVVKPPERRAA